ncbi:anthranilate synthase component 1 [Sphaeroforma arctica JP610]|uniref:anthranilate synthase n=1 Tax=Sphaeroforma arctica JP610 TaxID=667725 RepID=A0A0L0GEQ2_9EUKA|nr:anthranilate synthase component 1 [Sphaeroforma arctica JP610]KNC86738.1 anthranilate synthase component 1 [Sphaeroforma arctica JP610]|eukprot:XP_014160640.1 anthranilate synthase component 1 [Sphaeroforma arctica JP610]
MSPNKINITITPSFDEVRALTQTGNCVPVFASEQSDQLTPVCAFLKLGLEAKYGFLLESVSGGEQIGRYSFVGSNPYDVVACTGTDPLTTVEDKLKNIRFKEVKGLPCLTGGAIGYIGFDCIHSFEPKTARPLQDDLKVPDSIFMFCDELVAFDRAKQTHQVISHIRFEGDSISDVQLRELYDNATSKIHALVRQLRDLYTPQPTQKPIGLDNVGTSNIGQSGYEGHVHALKKHIKLGDIIQAVPSQRVSRPTDLHPFNIYRMLRTTNPSPYMFFIHLKDFQLVGASPEMLVKVVDRELETHPIAGTRKRGETDAEDKALMEELLADTKEIAEHVMLVDLGRNDSNRVCEPDTVRVTSLMGIEKYSHVMHIVSKVKGMLRPECSIYDAFRSIFPAGTVSGAPKIRAVQLIQEMEGIKRHFYAGAVGWFSYRGDTDTCIALRTMMCQDGVAYLQAGGGIVFDSDPTAEYEETVHKMKSNDDALRRAEIYFKEYLNC